MKHFSAALLSSVLLASLSASADPAPLDADSCVAVALQSSGQVVQAQGQIDEWQGRLKEVKALYGLRLMGLSYMAPIYGEHGNGFTPHYTVDLGQWGPYIHFESALVKPIYSFGTIEKGEYAASERLAVEKARYQQTRNALALEVRKYYYLYLYALSLKPTLDQGRKILDDALKQATEMYESGSGKVTSVDLNKLRFAASELKKALVQQRIGEELAFAALKHTMGLPNEFPLVLADAVLPLDPNVPIPDMSALLPIALDQRPETAQLKHGKAAATAAEEAQGMTYRPIVFLAGKFGFDYAPTRDHDNNPWHYDPYNGVSGGAALGIRFDIDLWGMWARQATAHGQVVQVDGLAKFAETGIPMEVRKAHDDLVQAHDMLQAATDGSTAAKKWMMFAGTAYSVGTGEARDILEGVGSYMQAKKGYFDALLALHTARAQLRYAIGDGPIPAGAPPPAPPPPPAAPSPPPAPPAETH